VSDTKIAFQCGNCFHWVPADAVGPVTIGASARGTCYGAPPGVAVKFDKHTGGIAGQANVRPATLESERACGAFVPRDALAGSSTGYVGGGPGANDDKVN